MKPSTERQVRGLAAALLLAAGTNQCVTDHDALAKRDDGDGGSAGTSGGRGGSSGASSAGTGGDGTAGKYTEPAGRSVVTFMNGVVDAERVAFCFARGDGDREEFVAEPAPASGLDFGHTFHVESLPDLDFSEDAITPYVIGGDLELVDGLDCEQAVALARELTALALPEDGGAPNGEGGAAAGEGGAGGESPLPEPEEVGGAGGAGPSPLPDPPALRVGALPALPAGTLSAGFSTLLVAEGCLGGPWFLNKKDDEICGAGYSGVTTLATSFVVMSRETAFNVGFQALNASRASGPLDARVSAPLDGVNVPISIADQIVDGKVEPVPANALYSTVDYGLDDPAFRVRFIESSGEECAVSWKELLDRGDVDAVEDGKNYVLVALGPRMGIGSESWWNRPTIGIAAADP